MVERFSKYFEGVKKEDMGLLLRKAITELVEVAVTSNTDIQDILDVIRTEYEKNKK